MKYSFESREIKDRNPNHRDIYVYVNEKRELPQ